MSDTTLEKSARATASGLSGLLYAWIASAFLHFSNAALIAGLICMLAYSGWRERP